MRRKLLAFCLLSFIFTFTLFAFNGGGWKSDTLEADLEVGTYSIDGDSSTGLFFDPDNDGTNEVTFGINGSIAVGGSNEEIEFTTFGEKILQDTDDIITLQGNSGTDDTDLDIDLDGVAPALSSGIDAAILVQEDFIVGLGNRTLPSFGTDKGVWAFSEDTAEANDYAKMFHDQSNGWLKAGVGGLNLLADNSIGLGGTSTITRFEYTINSGSPIITQRWDIDTDQFAFGVSNSIGNQFILTNKDNVAVDHDHATTTNPTLFFHSDTDPDDQNTQYSSITHDKDDATYSTGRGGHSFHIDAQAARGTITVTGLATADQTFVVNSTTITAKADGSGDPDHFTIGGSASAAVTNMVATINEGSETANVFALDGAGDTVVVEWRTAGTAGNSITFTEGLANATIDGGGSLGATTLGKVADILGVINQGDSDIDITYWLMYNADGEVCYVYPNATQDGILVSASKP